MPELPEVERARRDLARWLSGATITAAEARDRVVLRGASPRGFARALAGRRVVGIDRRGKWLRLALDDDRRLFSHLGMTGEWVLGEAPRWQRARLHATKRARGFSVAYVDPRRFGRLVLAERDIREWDSLGPDPLVDGIDHARLAAALARRRAPIKAALLDQAVLAGVGNIYATEALFRARIDPRAESSSVSPARLRALARALEAILSRAIEDPERPFAVYGRGGEPCPRCGAPLVRTVLAGRGTTFCARCQI